MNDREARVCSDRTRTVTALPVLWHREIATAISENFSRFCAAGLSKEEPNGRMTFLTVQSVLRFVTSDVPELAKFPLFDITLYTLLRTL